jgi:hypothetical protein
LIGILARLRQSDGAEDNSENSTEEAGHETSDGHAVGLLGCGGHFSHFSSVDFWATQAITQAG